MFFVLGKAHDIMQHGTFCITGRSCHKYHFCRNKTDNNVTQNLLAGVLVMLFVLGKAHDIMQHRTFCIIGRSCHKYYFCHNKTFVTTISNTPLS